jgi:hypothetical protein
MTSSVAAVLSESFEDVLGAVQDTARGRWFLDEFSKRQKSQDTASILAAIAKLENHIGSQSSSVDGAQVRQARVAIAAAKAKLSAMHNDLPTLSNEARMFAKLAELSRAALSNDKPGVARGVDVALSLVDELDQSFASAATAGLALAGSALTSSGPVAVAAVKPAGEAYFAADQDVFETPKAKSVEIKAEKPAVAEAPKPAVAAPVAAVVEEAKPAPKPAVVTPKVEDEQPRGAKLTINRVKPAGVVEVKPAVAEAAPVVAPVSAAEPFVEQVADVAIVTAPAAPVAEDKPKSRITIIRRKAEEVVAVPLVDEQPLAAQA